jgi:hypothetical protein
MNSPTCFSDKSPSSVDKRTNEHTILIYQFYVRSVKNIQNISYKYNNTEIYMIISYHNIYSSYFMYFNIVRVKLMY